MTNNKQNLKKADIIKMLVDEYGYDAEDLKVSPEGKPYTNAKLLEMMKSEEEDKAKLESEATRKVANKSKIKKDDEIVIMSGIDSVDYYSAKTNTSWKFKHFGQQDTMEYGELITMHNNHPMYLNEGYIIVLDKEVQDELKLTDMYKNILTPENIDSVFTLGEVELSNFIDALPEGQKQTLTARAFELYQQDKIERLSTIKVFQNKFNFSFEDNAPLDDIVDVAKTTGANNIIIVDKR